MQVLQAGESQVVLLELDCELLRQGAEEAGYACVVVDDARVTTLELSALEREAPLLVFDAAEPANGGWFSRCQFYIDGRSGAVMQTPFVVANLRDAAGRPHRRAIKVQIQKELPVHFRLPGRQAVNEKLLYGVLFSFLTAMLKVGVGLCGVGLVQPLAGRADAPER
ncbi:MAG: hypothetical protein IPP47_24935 [Bryobacterales bacterium]|nr:hypothetical protein [Bryobacterales bacterium]